MSFLQFRSRPSSLLPLKVKMLGKDEASSARAVDKSVKNKFCFEWLETKAVLNNQQIKGPKGYPSMLVEHCCIFHIKLQ